MTRLPLLLVVLALALGPGSRPSAAEAPTVAGVTVEGNRRVEGDAVKAAISTKPGTPLDRAKVDRDLKAVLKLGYFADVVVEERGPPDAPTLVFRVSERPAVREARITGNEELSTDDLKDTVEVKPYQILDLGHVRKSVKKIQEKYVDKGYYLAEVTYRLEEKPDNQIDVVFVVNEHAKVQVKEIVILGNEQVPREDLTAVMSTQEGGYLSFVTSSGTYREEAFQHDIQNIQFIYADRGYISAKVAKPSVALSPDKRFLFITIRIEEGEQYRVGKIDFAGELLHDKGELQKLIAVKPGDIFARSRVAKDLFAVADLYRDDGYANANVNPITNVDAKTRIVDVDYEVQPGKKTYFERIEIAGNSKTRDKVIRRELRIYEGELYNNAALNTSKSRVTALGYFENVAITTERGSGEDKLVARVNVKERSTGTFQIGAGFSSYETFILTGQISQNNFFGWGQTLSLQLQYSSIRQLGQIQFLDPYFLDSKWTFAFDIYATEGFFTTFVRKAIGGSMTWGYELNGLADVLPFTRNLEDFRLFATYTNEYVTVTPNGITDILLANRFRSGTTSAIRLSLQWDKRDNRLFPTSGFFHALSAEAAPPFLAPSALFGDRVNLFTRYTLDSRFYHPLFWGVVARAKLAAGYIIGWDDAHPVPISELYYLGGINSVRGYRLLSISPSIRVGASPDPSAATADFFTGGNKQVTLNLELEFPLFEKVGIKGVVFYDLGNTFKQGNFFSDPDHPGLALSLFKSVGFGFRWFSPIGPLRFEWGIPLDRRKDVLGNYIDNALDFQFTIGNFF
ncbi:MAG: outer membrane protein assembly factor BamA [Anaeromyxobacteraceae bacterium]